MGESFQTALMSACAGSSTLYNELTAAVVILGSMMQTNSPEQWRLPHGSIHVTLYYDHPADNAATATTTTTAAAASVSSSGSIGASGAAPRLRPVAASVELMFERYTSFTTSTIPMLEHLRDPKSSRYKSIGAAFRTLGFSEQQLADLQLVARAIHACHDVEHCDVASNDTAANAAAAKLLGIDPDVWRFRRLPLQIVLDADASVGVGIRCIVVRLRRACRALSIEAKRRRLTALGL